MLKELILFLVRSKWAFGLWYNGYYFLHIFFCY